MPNWKPPSHWPVYGDGFLMAAIDDVMFVYAQSDLSDAGFDHHLRELAAAIDDRAGDTRVGVIYDAGLTVSVDARRRKRSSEVLDARRDKLGRTTAAFSLVSESAVMAGILRAVFWLAPPPYPWSVARDIRGGLEFLAKHMPTLDIVGVEGRYRALLARFEHERARRAV